MAIALRAGAVMADVEFVQFHPTVLWLGEVANGQQPLISEAVRGEGAFLVDGDGVRFMQGVHEMADLAPRDVVARAIVARMRQTGTDHVYLDARHLGREFLEQPVPVDRRSLPRARLRPRRPTSLPVAPAQHYASGGVAHDLHGRYLPRWPVCLRRGLVHRRPRRQPAGLQLVARGPGLRPPHRRRHHRAVRRRRAAAGRPRPPRTGETGPARAEHRSRRAARDDGRHGCRAVGRVPGRGPRAGHAGQDHRPDRADPEPAAWEATNLLHLGQVLTTVAALREETRGGHLRSDFPERDDERLARPPPRRPRPGRHRRDVVPPAAGHRPSEPA